MQAHGLADAAPDTVADHGFAEGPGRGEADVRPIRLRLADAERRKERAGKARAPIVNSSEVFRSQQTDTFRKTGDGKATFRS